MKEYIVQAIAQETIDSFDAHNAPEIVRCKDCKYWEQYSDVPNIGNCPVLDQSRRDDWFCANGERKE